MEINDDKNNKFMVGLTCFGHKQKLEEKFLLLQRNNQIPQGEIIFTKIKIITTKCVTGNQEDKDDIQLKRL